MKRGIIAIVAIAFITLSAFAFIFYSRSSISGQDVLNSQSTTSSTSSGIVRTIYATLDHNAGYNFMEDGTSGTTITVNKGATVKIIANDNQPTHNHGITIDAYGINTAVIQPDTVIQFVANQAGTFKIWCKTCLEGPLGAHPWMTGTLVVNG